MRKLVGILALGALFCVGCGGSSGGADAGGAATADGTAGGGGVTAAQVRQLIEERFNQFDDNYVLWKIQPGLGTVMMEYGYRFAMAYMAAQAGDWAMAQYQLEEALEIQEVGEVTRPGKAELLKTFEHDHLDKLVADVEAKDLGAFNADYDAAVEGCNDCHQATGHDYVVVKKPAMSPVDYLAFAASEPEPAEEGEEEHQDAGSPAASGDDRPLSWQELYDMVDNAFNEPDRSLALWAIQPGLGTVMMEYGLRFALARFAAAAGDWGMAQYQIKEALEIQEVGETTRPSKADPLKAFEHASMDKLAQDIEAKDLDAFQADYDEAIAGCNSCHDATGHPYVRVVAPQAQPEALLHLAASDPVAPEEGEEHGTAGQAPSYPDEGQPTLDDAKNLIEQRLNEMNRDLALWAIQPGLGTVMIEYGYRFAMAYYAAQAGNWGMAQYQLKEATEIQEVGEVTRPAKADLLKAFEQQYLDPLMQAAQNNDLDAFNQAFDDAIGGCNSCHEATDHGYVRVQSPPAAPVDYLDL